MPIPVKHVSEPAPYRSPGPGESRGMARILLTQKDSMRSLELGLLLHRSAHTVNLVASIEEALEAALRSRPDVLVVDASIRAGIDAVEVCMALRRIQPSLQAILIADILTPDLEERARLAQILAVHEKPVRSATMAASIGRALDEQAPAPPWTIGFIEPDPAGRILYANERARALLGLREGSEVGAMLWDLLSYRSMHCVERTREQWMPLGAKSEPSTRFLGLTRSTRSGGRFVLIVEASEKQILAHPAVRVLSSSSAGNPAMPTGRRVTSGA